MPFTDALAERDGRDKVRVHVEPGLGEFYGRAHFDHPGPASLEILNQHFASLHAHSEGNIIVTSTKGETLTQLHDRVAYCLSELIKRADRDPSQPKTLLICTHAGAMIAAGRVLTGRMPAEVNE